MTTPRKYLSFYAQNKANSADDITLNDGLTYTAVRSAIYLMKEAGIDAVPGGTTSYEMEVSYDGLYQMHSTGYDGKNLPWLAILPTPQSGVENTRGVIVKTATIRGGDGECKIWYAGWNLAKLYNVQTLDVSEVNDITELHALEQ